ncbi:hypothetical protein [Microbulbifer sp. TYP-18]|uniref:DUF3592 domain-containing protein n=1 Tax=Microbulbifer sp. TYP-18 TaxID=3230024 RepID=UPI0034C63DF9
MQILNYFQEMFRIAAEGQAQGILFWISVYIFVICTYSLWFQVRSRSWPSTKGRLAKLGTKKLGASEWAISDQDYIGDALYTYSVSGKEYEGSRISPWVFVASHNARFLLEKQQASIQVDPNGWVKVYYNPGNPKKSFLIVAGKLGIVVTMLVSIIPFVLYWSKFYG